MNDLTDLEIQAIQEEMGNEFGELLTTEFINYEL
tara:strand:- start:178 stop:279 length:102 start_codon:yes stop_codon:yes gene_type:complete